MNDPMTILKRDHREVKAMLKELEESSPGRARQTLLRNVERALTLHMEIEESVVYPVVVREEGARTGEEAEVEHGLVREGLTKANDLVAEPGFGAVIAMLIAGINHHVQEEAKEILPELKERLTSDEWSELGDRIASAKAAGERRGAKRTRATAGAR